MARSVCGAAKTSYHNQVFLDGVKAALTADQNFRLMTGLGSAGRRAFSLHFEYLAPQT